MTENQQNDVQDPAEQYEVDTAVETEDQPEPSDAAPGSAEPAPVDGSEAPDANDGPSEA